VEQKKDEDKRRKIHEGKEAFDKRERVEQEIKFLIDASQIFTICHINFDIQRCQDRTEIRFLILQQRPAYEDQNLFQQDLDDELSKWQDNQTSICHLQNKSFKLTQKIKAAYLLHLIKKRKENKDEKQIQEAKEAFDEGEKVEKDINFLINISQILTFRHISFDI